jgi:hypothetical protein
MSTSFNDANAWLNGAGNLSLGNAGFDDLAGDLTNPYAKADCWVNVPLSDLFTFVQAGTLARTSAGIYTFALAAGATTGIVVVPLIEIFRRFTNTRGGPQNPHGIKVTDLVFAYTIATAGETSIGVTFATEVQTNATARAALTTPFGAVTYENPIGTVAATLPVAVQATPYVVRAVPAAPVFISVDNTDAFAEISFVNPGTAVATLTHVSFHASVALY